MSFVELPVEFYGYRVVQNPSNEKLVLYVGAVDAKVFSDLVSVDNAVKWDPASNLWRAGGRNRTISDSHWKSIKAFLSSSNNERILPTPIVASIESDSFSFQPFPKMAALHGVVPGTITINARFLSDGGGGVTPCDEKDRVGWVLDGQHRVKAFREWMMPDPYPVNVVLMKQWAGSDYEDVMRHQTYELNMGRPLAEDFKAAVREQYDIQLGHKEYKRQIALSWIRKDMEGRGAVFDPRSIVGAANLRTPYVISMSLLEKIIQIAFESDSYLTETFVLEKMSKDEVKEVGKYLFDFYEGVRLSLGVLNPNTKGTIGTEPEVAAALDYWDIARTTDHKQRLLHNVGLKAVTRGLLNPVMRGTSQPKSPQEVAKLLAHMKGIPWHDIGLQAKKDDWVVPLANALGKMYQGPGTADGKMCQLILEKLDKQSGNVIDKYQLTAYGWKD